MSQSILYRLALLVALALPANGQAANVRDILDANKAASGGNSWDGKATLKLSFAYSGQGLKGETNSLVDLQHSRFVDTYNIPPDSGASGFDGNTPWLKDGSGLVRNQEGGDTPELSVNEAYRARNLWWRSDFGAASIVSGEAKQSGGKAYDVLTVTPHGGKPFHAWFDAGTHLLARIIEVQGPQTITSTYSNYRAIAGVKLPGTILIDDGTGPKYAQTLALKKAEFLPAQPPQAYARPAVQLHDFSLAGGTETTVPFQLMNNHLYAKVKVNGKGPLLFLFDTGGHNNLTPRTARLVGAHPVGQTPGSGAGSNVVDESETRIETLQIGNATVRDQVFGVLEFETPETAGYMTDGMVGVQVFGRFVTRVDYGAHTITLMDPKHFNADEAGVSIHIVFDGHIPMVKATFEGVPGMYYIDTGSRAELGLTKPFAEREHLRQTHPKGVVAIEGWGVGGPSRAFITKGRSLKIGPFELHDVVTSFSIDKGGAFMSASYEGNIGSALLKRFVVTFDYAHELMYLKPLPAPVPDTGVFDRSGMWINADPAGFRVYDVTQSGPAEQAGLAKDDLIVAVDGRPAKDLKLHELRRRLRDEPARTVVTFTVVRHGDKSRQVKLTLRDLI